MDKFYKNKFSPETINLWEKLQDILKNEEAWEIIEGFLEAAKVKAVRAYRDTQNE